MNNQTNAFSTGKYVAEPKVPYFNGVLSASQAPLLPGLYRVEFIMNNRIVGKGSINIKTPQKVSVQVAQQVYIKALQKMQAGLEYFFQGNIPAMKQQVQTAMPDLRKALYNAPNLPDIYAVYETANALLSLEKVDQAIRHSQNSKAKTWLDISSVYTKSAMINCQDQELKISIQKIRMVIDQLSQK
jgi:outer membrane usher protein FimD/PapC